MEYFKNASLLTPLINVKIDVFWQKLQGSQTFLKVCQVNEVGESILRLLQNDTALSRSEISQKIRLSERRTRPLFVKLIQKGKVLEIARSKKDHHKKIYTKKRRPLARGLTGILYECMLILLICRTIRKGTLMLTTIRLDQILKNRISALPLLSHKAKSFSHALRYLVDLGLATFDQSLNVVNQDIETNIRFIAQKHDLGDQLSNQEISFILINAGSALSGRSFVHDETMQMLADTFASFIKSRCYAANDPTIHHVFKKFNLVEEAFGDQKGGNSFVSLLSQDFYQSMEEGAESFKARLEAHSCPSNEASLIEPLKAFINCLISFSQQKEGENEGHLLSPVAFREALDPYMTAFIQIAKCAFSREEGGEGTPPFHTSSQNLFVHQQGLEKPFHFSSTHIFCHIWANHLTNVYATFVFEKKGVTLSLGFRAFDDLLEMARSTGRFISFREQGKETRGSLNLETSELNFLWSSDIQNKITSLLQTKSSSLMLDSEETERFIDLLLKISKELSEPLKALRYQLGSI